MKPVCYMNKDSPGILRDILTIEHLSAYFIVLN